MHEFMTIMRGMWLAVIIYIALYCAGWFTFALFEFEQGQEEPLFIVLPMLGFIFSVCFAVALLVFYALGTLISKK